MKQIVAKSWRIVTIKLSKSLETLLFESVAGLENLHEVLRRFTDRSLVRLLQLEGMLKTRGDFFSSRCRFFSTSSSCQLVVVRKVGGRRTDVQRNCFFSALPALVPSSIFEDRLGRATSRVLRTRGTATFRREES